MKNPFVVLLAVTSLIISLVGWLSADAQPAPVSIDITEVLAYAPNEASISCMELAQATLNGKVVVATPCSRDIVRRVSLEWTR